MKDSVDTKRSIFTLDFRSKTEVFSSTDFGVWEYTCIILDK